MRWGMRECISNNWSGLPAIDVVVVVTCMIREKTESTVVVQFRNGIDDEDGSGSGYTIEIYGLSLTNNCFRFESSAVSPLSV